VDFKGTPAADDVFTLAPLNSSYSISRDSTMATAHVTGFDSSQPITIRFDGTDFTAVYDSETPIGTIQVVENDGVLTLRDGGIEIGTVKLYGTPTAGSSATIQPTSGSVSREELNVFAALDEVIEMLGSPASTAAESAQLRNALSSAMQRVDVTYNNVLSVRASTGTRMNELDALSSNGSARIL